MAKIMRVFLGTILLGLLSTAFISMQVLAITDFNFSESLVSVTRDETFDLLIEIDPHEELSYTTRVELNYPSDLLEVISFDFSDNWMSLALPEYDLIDNTEGVIIKSAGYPEGLEKSEIFGTVTFRAKSGGTGTITIGEDSFSFDEENEDVLSTDLSEVDVLIGPFVDIEEHWAKEFILDLYWKNIISGYDETHYGPKNDISRAEFTKIVVGAMDISIPELSETEEILFTDVNLEDWYTPYIHAAFENEIIDGYGDGTFRPNDAIGRAEAMKILLEAEGMDIETQFVAEFTDVVEYVWYLPYINYAVEYGIASGYGDGTFGPENNLTRGEAAKIVSNKIN